MEEGVYMVSTGKCNLGKTYIGKPLRSGQDSFNDQFA